MARRALTDVWVALRSPRFLLSWWPWRVQSYLITSAVLALVMLPLVLVTLLLLPIWGMLFGALERRRVRLLGFARVRQAHLPLTWSQRHVWLGVRLAEPVTWREVAHLVVSIVLGLACVLVLLAGIFAIVIPVTLAVQLGGQTLRLNLFGDVWIIANPSDLMPFIGVGLLVLLALAYLGALLSAMQASIARALLSPRQEELESQVARLTIGRESLVRAFEAERRRIERDLHDGTQQQLVALSLSLGLARLDLDAIALDAAPVQAARRAVAEAQERAELALDSLRSTVRGIHPQVLGDHGLAAAVQELVGRQAVPVSSLIELEGRLPDAVEATAYFAVSEALTNITRHARASAVAVTGALERDRLVVIIEDDGIGGADLVRGSGLAGLRERARVHGGELTVESPVGGPTRLRLSIPVD